MIATVPIAACQDWVLERVYKTLISFLVYRELEPGWGWG